jgi:hypothetical protein
VLPKKNCEKIIYCRVCARLAPFQLLDILDKTARCVLPPAAHLVTDIEEYRRSTRSEARASMFIALDSLDSNMGFARAALRTDNSPRWCRI